MMKQLKYFVLLLVLFAPVSLPADEAYKRIYVFGDSLSDTGNLASVVGGFPNPPYFNNRVTNGLVAVEVMANRLGLPLETSLHLIGPASGNNYSVVGARASRNGDIDLSTQVALFLANHGGVAPDDTLYVMFIGGNDIRTARDTTDLTAAVQVVEETAQTIANQIQVLIASGARNWLVVNAPDIGRIPETYMIAEALGLPGLPNWATTLTVLFNDALKRQMQQLDDMPGVDIERFNIFKLFARIIDKGDKLGFTNTTEACFSSEQGIFLPGCNFGFSFDQYIFFDEIHPTARVHELVGIALSRRVQDKDRDDHKEKKGVESAED